MDLAFRLFQVGFRTSVEHNYIKNSQELWDMISVFIYKESLKDLNLCITSIVMKLFNLHFGTSGCMFCIRTLDTRDIFI